MGAPGASPPRLGPVASPTAAPRPNFREPRRDLVLPSMIPCVRSFVEFYQRLQPRKSGLRGVVYLVNSQFSLAAFRKSWLANCRDAYYAPVSAMSRISDAFGSADFPGGRAFCNTAMRPA